MTFIKIFTVIFVAFTWSRAILRFNDKAIGYREFLFWSGIWSAVLLVVFNPGIADRTALILNLQRGADAMFFFSTILLFYLIFRLYVKLDLIDRALSKLNEESSIEIHRLKDR
jgi:hypothetical protein